MPSVRQAGFAGGEVDPLLYGRTDHPRYPSAARKVLNFLIAPQGAAKNRGGTKLVAKVKDPTIQPRRIPFLWPSQNYVLEFGNLNVRFTSNGGQILDPATGLPLEVVTPFTSAMLPFLKFSQKDDTLTLDYGGQEPGGTAAVAPQELKRVAHTNWTISAVNFGVPAVAAFSPPGGWNGVPGLPIMASPAPQPDATHFASQWGWEITQLLQDANGNVFESFATVVGINQVYSGVATYALGDVVIAGNKVWTSIQGANTGNNPATSPTFWADGVVFAADRPFKLTWTPLASVGYTRIGFNIYRGRPTTIAVTLFNIDTPVGFVGTVEASGTQFFDGGTSPDYTQQPPKQTNPFALAAGGFDYPTCVASFQQRRIFARQGLHLARIQASKTGQASNFDTTLISQDTDALKFDLATQAIEEIRSLVSLRALIALTQTGAMIIRGSGNTRSGGTAIAPASIDATKQSQRGASWVDPVVVDNVIVFAQAKGSSIRTLAYDPYWETLSNPGNDVAIVAQHFLRAHTVVDMAYQEAPDSVIWIVREDGVLLGLTFVPSANPDQQVYAWHQHTTDGLIEDVCVVPEGTEDALYLGVKRTVNGATVRYTERMASRVVTDVRTCCFLDCALSFDGRNTGPITMKATTNGATYNGGDEMTVLASAPSFTADDVGSTIVLNPDSIPAVLDFQGIVVTPLVPPFTLTILAYTDATHVTARLEGNLAAAFQNAPTTSWAFGRRSFKGLDHLEGKTVAVLRDGAVATAAKPDSSLVVTGGQITIDNPAVLVTAGLPYTSDLELLDVKTEQNRTNVQASYTVSIEIAESRGCKVGETFEKLYDAKPQPKVPADAWGNPSLTTGIVQTAVGASWNVGGRAVVRQTDPLPLTVLSVIREQTGGGKGP